MDFAAILRDVTPGVGLLIAIIYISREALGIIKEQQKQQATRDSMQDKFNRDLLTLISAFPAALKELQESNELSLKELQKDSQAERKEIVDAITAQTKVIADKLQPVTRIEQTIKSATSQIIQET